MKLNIVKKEGKEMAEQENKRTHKEITKRYILFIISLFFSALGVAITKKGELGVSPISSVANVLSIKFSALSLGNWLIAWNAVLILGQIILLRKKFQWIQLLQLPLSILFGYFTDFSMWIVSHFEIEAYPIRLAMIIIGTIVLGFGIALSVIADVIMNSGEAFVKAISDTIHRDFGKIKTIFDISCVAVAVLLSLLFFNFTIEGTREGTIIAAFLTGSIVGMFSKKLLNPINNIMKK